MTKAVSQKTMRAGRNRMRGFTPPADLTVSEWAEKNRRLSAEASAETGAWRNDRTPYLVDIMNAFNDPKIKRIVMVAASQVGKSEFELNCIGYIIDEDPGSILFIHPTEGDAREFSKLRVAPMIRDCAVLRKKVSDPKQRDSTNTIKQKAYPGGILTLCGSGEAHALASKPIRYIIGDERDRWATSAGNEGDPWKLALARQRTFYNAKALEVSTPTIKGASAIEKSYAAGTMERWCTKCPHCGEYHEIKFANIRFEYDANEVSGKKTYVVKDVCYVCPDCGCVSSEYDMKHSPAKWIPENPEAYEKGCRSFWLNAFVSQWASWESIIQEFLDAKDNPNELKVVYNTSFGELWEDRGDMMDEDGFLARREDYGTREDGTPIELPDGVLVLTCGVDTQDNRLEYEVKGYGHFSESWGIKKGIIMGRPDDPETWKQLDDVIDHVYRYEDGLGIKISLTFIDEGGHFTQSVREQCANRIGKHVFCIKGIPGMDHPYTSPPKQMKIVKDTPTGRKMIGTCWQYQIGVDAGKQVIMDNLKVQTTGSRYCHFPKNDDYGLKYFTGLISERLVYNEKKKKPWEWVKIPGHERNEVLDITNYANAAFKCLSVDLDQVHRRLMAARGKTLPDAPAVQTTVSKQVRKHAQKRRFRNMNDEW